MNEDETEQPVERKYAPGKADHNLNALRATRKREQQKREANRPTGTEIEQIKRKQQEMIEQLNTQQKALTAAVNTISRITPDPSGQEQSTGNVSVGVGQTVTVHSFSIAIPSGKTRAFVAMTSRAHLGGNDAIGLLEIFEDNTMVAANIGFTPVGGGSSAVTFCATFNGNHSFSFRVLNPSGNTKGMALDDLHSYFSVTYYADASLPVIPTTMSEEENV